MIDAMFLALNFSLNFPKKELCSKVKNLNATEYGETSEESHCASDHTQLGHQGHLGLAFSKLYKTVHLITRVT